MKKTMLVLMLFYVSFSCAEEIVDSKESINSQDPFIGAWTIQGDRSSFSEIWFITSDGSFTLDDVTTGNWSNKSSDFDIETQKYQLITSEYCHGDDCIENLEKNF